jgi:hypothetical protein
MTGARTLDCISDHAGTIQGVWADDVQVGDWVVVRTRNSLYSLAALGHGRFHVAGGWFAAQGVESVPVRVVGCTWGGRAILTGLVAAPGMFIEFDNRVQTTRVRDVRLLRGGAIAVHH